MTRHNLVFHKDGHIFYHLSVSALCCLLLQLTVCYMGELTSDHCIRAAAWMQTEKISFKKSGSSEQQFQILLAQNPKWN